MKTARNITRIDRAQLESFLVAIKFVRDSVPADLGLPSKSQYYEKVLADGKSIGLTRRGLNRLIELRLVEQTHDGCGHGPSVCENLHAICKFLPKTYSAFC